MADSEDPFARHEEDFQRGLSWKTKRDMRKMDRLCEELEDWEIEADDVRHHKIEALMLAAGLAASLLLLYSLWMVSLGGGAKFRFKLSNSWPAILFAGLLAGHHLHDCVEKIRYWAYALGQFWRRRSRKRRSEADRSWPRWSHAYCRCWYCRRNKTHHSGACRCMVCRAKRRYRARKVYPCSTAQYHWHRDNRSGTESRSPLVRRRKRKNQH